MQRSRLAAALALVAGCAAPAPEPDEAVPPRPAPPLAGASHDPAPESEADERSSSSAAEPGSEKPEHGPAGWVAGRPLDFEEILLEWHRTSARDFFLVVEKLIAARLAFAEADRLGLRLDAEAVEATTRAEIARFKRDVADEAGGLTPEEFIRRELGIEPERYWKRIREGVIRQMIAERSVRVWSLANDSAAVRLIVVRTEEEAAKLREELDAGADFAALAREHSVDDSARDGGFVPYLVRSESSPLARVVFTADAGTVLGPLSAAGHYFLARVEERRGALLGSWEKVGPTVEASLREHPVAESEFLPWKLEMEQRYPVDLGPLLALIGVPRPNAGELPGEGDPSRP